MSSRGGAADFMPAVTGVTVPGLVFAEMGFACLITGALVPLRPFT